MHATILPHPLAVHNQLAFRIYICYNQGMAKHITKIDDIEDEAWRNLFHAYCKTAYNGDEPALVASYNQQMDNFEKITVRKAGSSKYANVSLRFSNQKPEAVK